MDNELVYTQSAILDLLMQIDELRDYNIDLSATEQGDMTLTIGDSVYEIQAYADDVEVDPEVVDEVSDINESNLSSLADSEGVDLYPIESGLVKEIIKTLAVGGIVRLTKKLLS